MSTIIKFDLKELRKLANDKNSCIIEKKVTQNLALQPWCLSNPKDSIKKLLDYKIGKFDKEFDGILLNYKKFQILQNVGAIRNDNAEIYFQVQADYFIFRPYVGATLKGIVNKKTTTHLCILVHRVFNVVIPRPTEEPGNYWVGSNVTEGQEVVFQIVMLDLYGALPYIRGKLDERRLKSDHDVGDEAIETKPAKSISVAYVNFDKTKPNQKQDGDKLVHTSSKKKSIKKNSKESNSNVKNNNSNGQLEHIENVIHNSEKTKRKKHDPEMKHLIKKSKKNVQKK